MSSAPARADCPEGSALSAALRGRVKSDSASSAGVVEAAVVGARTGRRPSSRSSPAAASQRGVAGRLVQGEQPLGEVAVVVGHAAARARRRPPREARRSRPSTRCAASDEARRTPGGRDQLGRAEQAPGLGEGGDGEAVPRRSRPCRRGRAAAACCAPRAAACRTRAHHAGVVGVGGQLERGRAVLEGARRSVTPNRLGRPRAVDRRRAPRRAGRASRRRSDPRRRPCRRRAPRRSRPRGAEVAQQELGGLQRRPGVRAATPVARCRCA